MTLRNITFFKYHENGLLFAFNKRAEEIIYISDLSKGEVKYAHFTVEEYEESNAFRVKLDHVRRHLKAECESKWNLTPIRTRKRRKKKVEG